MAKQKRYDESDTTPEVGTASLFERSLPQPLAARMRPRTLDEIVGQQHLLAAGKPLRETIEKGTVGSMILWGAPGTGKTTIARVVAQYTERAFVAFSAVTEGVPRVREIVAEAEGLRRMGRGTILFADEIHRFNKAQQDAFLPHVEAGTITLIGATTENPSFEINGALLSRLRVFVLHALSPDDLRALIARALRDPERGLGERNVTIDADALLLLATEADGDARRALTSLEAAADHVGRGGQITVDVARDALQLRFARFDKGGEETYVSQEPSRQRPSRCLVLDGPDDRGRSRSDDYFPAIDCHGRRGYRARRSRGTEAGGRRARCVPHARSAGRLPSTRPDGRLPGNGAEVEQLESRIAVGAGGGALAPRRGGSTSHSECANRVDEGTGLWSGVPIRA
jgi:DNA polymerase III delta prime subunit